MNTRLFIPGPTARAARHGPLIGHRSDAFDDLLRARHDQGARSLRHRGHRARRHVLVRRLDGGGGPERSLDESKIWSYSYR